LFFSPHFSTDEDLDKVDLDRDANDRLIFYQQVEDSLITQKQNSGKNFVIKEPSGET
jgi:hypothetical protein